MLLPLTLFVNWRLAAVLIIPSSASTAITSHVLRKTETMQGDVERYSADLAEHASGCARQCACNSKLYADREQIPGHAQDH